MMKKAKKIMIGVIGGVAAIGATIAGKIAYDKSQEAPIQNLYGIFDPGVVYINKEPQIEYGLVTGSKLKEIIQTIETFNEQYSKNVEYIGPQDADIVPENSYELTPEYQVDGSLERVIASDFIEIIEEGIEEE